MTKLHDCIDLESTVHSLEAFSLRDLERLLHAAERRARYCGTAFGRNTMHKLARRLTKDRRNVAATRTKLMRTKT